ncbi:MAG: hypothetical protein ISEC1_P1848 [Thiomicrorhabdus sp.]|nr:MAG: hypothetical protein ISEC1_P1848 [Thiomicrorhabdus sp.]
MNNFIKMLLVVVVVVAVPLLVLLGIWSGFLPESLQPVISLAGVVLAATYIIGGNLHCMYSDIKTGRYSK